MNPVESFLRYISSPAFAESVFSRVAGNAAYDSLKPTIEKIIGQLAGKPASEDDLKNAMEELIIQIGAHTNLNINQLRAEILAAIGQKSTEIPRQLTPYTPINATDECIGRDEDLKKLADTLRRSPKVVVVNGLGGIGKTTLAKAWFQKVLVEYDHFLWIEMAGNDDRRDQHTPSFEETIAYHPTLSANLHLSFGEKEPLDARFQAIMNALRQLKGRNLLVVDNAGPDLEQKEIREQLPLPPDWQVLVTSRSRLNGYEQMRLDRLSPEHAAELFRLHFSGLCPDAELDELLREVDYHTLTVELLAKTLENHLGSLTLSDLTAKLRRRELADSELQRRISLNHSAEETEVSLHLLATFDVAGLDDKERLLLARFAALPPGGAYSAAQLEEWLQTEPADRRQLHETLARLDRKGWLTCNADHSFTLHRMIQQATPYQLQPGMAELGVLVKTFTQKMDFDTSTNFTALFQWIPFAEQVLAVLAENERGGSEISKLIYNLGIVYLNLGQYERACDLLEAALVSNLKVFGPDHPNVAAGQMSLGWIYNELGQYEKSRDLLEAALDLALKSFGPDHPNVAVGQSNLGWTYNNLGQYDKARNFLEAALASDLKFFGQDHSNVTRSQSNLANVYRNLGQYERACDLLETALTFAVKTFGQNHPYVAIYQDNLAKVYIDLGQYERARDLIEAALASDLKNFGQDHPNVAVRQINLGVVFLKTGEKEKAKALFHQAYDLFKKLLGEQHPKTQTAKEWLDSA